VIFLNKEKNMKSIQVNGGGLDNMKIVETPNPMPKAGEILVKWHATSLNFHDYLVAIGGIPVPENRVPMSDGAGEIIGIGEGVTKWKVGDKVMSLFFPNWIDGRANLDKTRFISGETVNGFIIEQSCISAESVTEIPQGYTYAEAATLPCAALTAWRGLVTEGRIQPGDTVLIEGTGGMSIFGLQIALAAGATVYATTSSVAKAARLKQMGVTAVVNYKEDSRWGKTIFKMSGGGVDHVLDVGGGSTMGQSIEAAKIGGSIIAIGILGNGRKGEITFPKLFFKHLKMTGIAVDCRLSQEAMVRAINVAHFKPIIDRSFGFEELAAAFRYQETGQHFGKIVVEW
jgi:NADPH:quinone reductase-like Zn-dependent oxidoreductase|tara:strand:+ start:390 stop:1418 length:1029 start_codon:yes stop_codon:yes gene_type:complete